MPEPVWPLPPATLALEPGRVHVWRAWLEPEAPVLRRLEATLSDDERARAARFVFPQHRVRYAAGRGILREILGRYLGRDPRSLRFRYSAHGKPELDETATPESVRFNVSNCEAMGLFAFVRGREVGVDVEELRPMPDGVSIAERFFSGPENEVFRAVPPELRDQAFFNCWTRKEAYIKAVGEGLSMPLDRFDVAFAPGQAAALLATRPDPAQAERWTLRELEPGPGWIGALMVEGKDWGVDCWEWTGEVGPSSAP